MTTRSVWLAAPLLAAAQAFAPAAAAGLEEGPSSIAALIQAMTVEEKIGQLSLGMNPVDPQLIRSGAVGAVMNVPTRSDADALAALGNESRLKIRPLIALDVVHGYRTLFPVPIAEAASFDPELGYRSSYWSALEASEAGVHLTFAPMADISRDVRWGRIVEGAGEDPLLASLFTAARVRGFRDGGLATTTKHFVGYGAALGGKDYATAEISEPALRDVYLPPFRAAIKAGTDAVMSAFTAVNGLPVAADPRLLRDLLRGEMGFRGVLMSDYAAADELLNHGVAADRQEAAVKALESGVDMEMASDAYRSKLPGAILAGEMTVQTLDDAVRRVLELKQRMGLIGVGKPRPPARAETTPEARRVARDIAAQSMVLLQNHDGVLPLRSGSGTLAVIGPFADSRREQNGPHEAHGREEETVSLLQGLRARASAAGMSVLHAPGCSLACENDLDMDEAVAVARQADVVVATLGEPRDFTGEGATRAHLDIPGRQMELLRRLAETGKPVVLVLSGGRPVVLGEAVKHAAAILMAWYPGSEGGPALAGILFGDVNPSARLPHTWPRALGQVPIHYDELPSGRPHQPGQKFTQGYVDEQPDPQYPFGFGLSYTSFAYSDLRVVKPRVNLSGRVELEVTLTNTGQRRGKEAAQLYVRDLVASRSRPVRQLKGLQKVELQPGESRTLHFVLPVVDLGFHLPDGSYVVEPGRFQIWVGGDSRASLSSFLEVVR